MNHPLALPLILAFISIFSLVAMFIFNGIWDAVFFVLSLLPLLMGLWRWYRNRPIYK
jgi:hypothetical protein